MGASQCEGGSEDLHCKGAKMAENRTLTDVTRCYLGFTADFLWLIDVRKGPGN